MGAADDLASYFYVQTFSVGARGRLELLAPERITVKGQPSAAA